MSKDDRLSPATRPGRRLEGTLHQEEARESARGGLLRKKRLRGKVDDEGREKLIEGTMENRERTARRETTCSRSKITERNIEILQPNKI